MSRVTGAAELNSNSKLMITDKHNLYHSLASISIIYYIPFILHPNQEKQKKKIEEYLTTPKFQFHPSLLHVLYFRWPSECKTKYIGLLAVYLGHQTTISYRKRQRGLKHSVQVDRVHYRAKPSWTSLVV